VKTILVAIDLSDFTPAVVEQAARIASDSASRLCLLHVGPAEADFLGQQLYRKVVEGEVPEQLRERYQKLRELERELRDRGIDASSLLAQGKAIETILEEASRSGAEMIVLGSHKGGALYRLLGSTSEGVLRGATSPVLIVPSLPKR
jgi:nucleotide-binding universal stress UspA family protein